MNLVLHVTQKFLLSTEHTEKADFFSSLKARNLWRKSFFKMLRERKKYFREIGILNRFLAIGQRFFSKISSKISCVSNPKKSV